MSNIDPKRADLSDRKRVGPEDESREQQFEGAPPSTEGDGKVSLRRDGNVTAGHDIENSNDLTTP